MFWSKIGCSEVISSCTVRQRTLDSQQSVKAVDGGHSCGIWAPWSIIKSSYVLGHHLKSRSQGIRVWNSSEVVQSCKTLEKSTESQTWSTGHLISDLMDGIDLKEFIHVYTSLICHVQPHHGRI